MYGAPFTTIGDQMLEVRHANGHAILPSVEDLRAQFEAEPQPARRYRIVPAEVPHVYALADTLRPADRAEIEGLGVGIKKALWRAYRSSIMCRTALVTIGGREEVAAMWGLCLNYRDGVSLLSDMGVPWLHTSAAIEAIKVSFVREAKTEVAAMRAMRPMLENYVAADYDQAVRFIRLLGFTVDEPKPLGRNGGMYSRFHVGF